MKTIPARRPVTGDYLTIPEIAFLTSQKRGTVEHWRIRYEVGPNAWPVEDDSFATTPVWALDRILTWIDNLNESRADHAGKQKVTYDVAKWRKHRAAGGFRRTIPRGPKRTAALKAATK